MLIRSLLFVASLFPVLAVCAEPTTPEEYIQIFKGDNVVQQQEAAQTLEWAGLSSPQVFDLVEAKALQALPNATDKFNINYVSYLVKALAYSGNEKYRPTIEKIMKEAPHKKVKKYAQEYLPQLTAYSHLNPLIVPKPWPENPYPSLNQRLVNMLVSDDTELMRIAAKRINWTNNYSPELLAQLNTSLLQNYQKPLKGERLDAVAWLAHALAGSRSAEYKATIEKVASSATEPALQKYGKKYLKYYQ